MFATGSIPVGNAGPALTFRDTNRDPAWETVFGLSHAFAFNARTPQVVYAYARALMAPETTFLLTSETGTPGPFHGLSYASVPTGLDLYELPAE